MRVPKPTPSTVGAGSERGPSAAVDRRTDVRRLFALSGPVVLAEIGWMSMGVADTMIVGPLGPAAIGAVGVGSTLFMAVAVFGMGLLLGLDTLVSQAYGAGRLDECRRWLHHGLLLALLLAIPMTAAGVALSASLAGAGLHPEVAALAIPYTRILSWSLLPLLCYAAFRRYLQGTSLTRPVMIALVTANGVNVAANWVLVYGHLGAPAMGTDGSAWATVISRVYMAGVLAAAIVTHDRGGDRSLWRDAGPIERRRLRALVSLGLPAAAQITLEVAVFAAVSALAGRLEPAALAAHQIALNVVSVVFMVPLGFASASAVLVGQAFGRGSPDRAARSGWLSLRVIAGFMLLVATAFVSMPRVLLGLFTRDASVILLGSSLLRVAAVFQLFDGLQVVATGILRGAGDTRTPMVWNLAGHWVLGLPVGYTLCFIAGWGVVGLWVGLSVGLTLVGCVLVTEWARRMRGLQAAGHAPLATRLVDPAQD